MNNVKAFRLYNFMAFQDSGWIEFNAISLLFGRNSSGKSVIIRALRLLKQSLERSEPGQALVLSSEDGIRLGAFNTILHNGGKTNQPRNIFDPNWLAAQVITFQFRCMVDNSVLEPLVDRINRLLRQRPTPEIPFIGANRFVDLSLQFAYEHDAGTTESTRIQLVGVHLDCDWSDLVDSGTSNIISAVRLPNYDDIDGLESVLYSGKLEQSQQEEAKPIRQGTLRWSTQSVWESDLELSQPAPNDERTWDMVTVTLPSGFLPDFQYKEKPHKHDSSDPHSNDFDLFGFILKDATDSTSEFLRSIQHLGPLRPEPQREYIFTAKSIARWRRQGLSAMVEFLRTAPTGKKRSEAALQVSFDEIGNEDSEYALETTIKTKREMTVKGQEQREQVKNALDHWLQVLELGSSYRLRRQLLFEDEGFIASLDIADKTGRFDNISDVGSGVSQVLPIVITSLNASPNALIIIEQPELHLHPRAQASLADLFIEAQKPDLSGKTKKESNRFLIETHSEHILLRLRRRIAESTINEISPNDNLYIQQNDVQAIFIDRSLQGVSTAESININEFGEMASPVNFKGFFADDAREIAKLTAARLKGQMKEVGT